MTNLEYDIMKKERETLKGFFRYGMENLLDKFFSRDLIFRQQLGKTDEKAVDDVFSVLEEQVKLNRDKFYVIVSCLEETEAMRDVAAKLKESLKAKLENYHAGRQQEDLMRSGQAAMLCQYSIPEEMQHHQTCFRGDADSEMSLLTHSITSPSVITL